MRKRLQQKGIARCPRRAGSTRSYNKVGAIPVLAPQGNRMADLSLRSQPRSNEGARPRRSRSRGPEQLSRPKEASQLGARSQRCFRSRRTTFFYLLLCALGVSAERGEESARAGLLKSPRIQARAIEVPRREDLAISPRESGFSRCLPS